LTISNECAEADPQARLLFEDRGLWETALKLKAQIGSTDPGDRMYADALGGLLAHGFWRPLPVWSEASYGCEQNCRTREQRHRMCVEG
jgi:hypothetical protein